MYLHLHKNIFLVTNPLINKNNENEIEDLFSKDTLSHKIRGKSFTKNDKYDSQKYYGKNDFSNYIMKNFKKIDFANFHPLLNAINQIQQIKNDNE